MSTDKAPAMPFIIPDLMASAKVQAMTTEEFGAYMLLLMSCWMSGKCRVPKADKALAAITKLGTKKWKAASKAILPCFEETDVEFLTNRKLQQVWKATVEQAELSTPLPDFSLNDAPLHFDPNAPDWLQIEADFLKRWNSLAGASDRGHGNAMPNNLVDRFRALWFKPGWWEEADRAMTKLASGLKSGIRISLRSFLTNETTITEILGTTHDWTKDKRSKVGLNAVSGSEAQINSDIDELLNRGRSKTG